MSKKSGMRNIFVWNFVITCAVNIFMIGYNLVEKLPLIALTIFPISVFMVGFSFVALYSKNSIWLLGAIVPSAMVWFFLPMKWVYLVAVMMALVAFVYGIVAFIKSPKEDKRELIREQGSKWKGALGVAVPTLLVACTFIYCAYHVPVDSFYIDNTMDVFETPAKVQGTVEKVEYTSYIYDENGNEGTQMQKFCYVYLPNGYDESENYNVLYLMHGGGANAGSWILEEEGNTTKNMLDTMIADGIIEPLIVVCPSFYYYNDSSKGGDTALFKYELRNNLMPAVEGKYSTYADMDTSEVGFINSRDHRGFGGFSMGSATTYQSALIGSLDYFSYFAPMHGGFISHDAVLEALTEGEFKDYEINYLLCCEGTLDSTYPQHLELYHKLLDTGKVCEGINADMLTLLYRQHNMNAWQTDLYNVLIRFF